MNGNAECTVRMVGCIQANNMLTTSIYKISAKCLGKKEHNACCVSVCTGWGGGVPSDSRLAGSLFTYAKHSDLLNILLRALQRSFRRLKILLRVPSDLQNNGKMNSSHLQSPTCFRASSSDSKQHIFYLVAVLNYCRKGVRSLIARGASCMLQMLLICLNHP